MTKIYLNCYKYNKQYIDYNKITDDRIICVMSQYAIHLFAVRPKRCRRGK